tara:strand:- start:406 stop:861 length:456 start_codon:yes stop_codon:yes gene_type:complete
MASDYILTSVDDLHAVSSYTHDHFQVSNKPLKCTITVKATRTTSMNALWRGKWMYETAEWMNNQGVTIEVKNAKGEVISRRPVQHTDAHEMFVMHWLGCDDKGLRELTRDMQKGRMLYMMDKHSHWAVEKGLLLTYPSDSEYADLMNNQNN